MSAVFSVDNFTFSYLALEVDACEAAVEFWKKVSCFFEECVDVFGVAVFSVLFF